MWACIYPIARDPKDSNSGNQMTRRAEAERGDPTHKRTGNGSIPFIGTRQHL
jgi:hypothetical protein